MNMKALPMLDHVMLWVARVFATLLTFFVAYMLWVEYTDDDLELIYQNTHDVHVYEIVVYDAALYGTLSITWLICAWRKPTNVTRTLLGLSAGITALWMIVTTAANSPFHSALVLGMGIRDTLECLVAPAVLILGLFSLLWAAIRAPENSSSTHLVHNPVNLVNPV